MRIGVIGAGRLGLALALNLSESSNQVYVHEISSERKQEIQSGHVATIEPEINTLLSRNPLNFFSLEDVLHQSEVVFVTVRTEGNPDGSYDCSQVFSLMHQIAACAGQANCVLVINCNVNVGTTKQCQKILGGTNIRLAYSPEWVAQGSIIKNQLDPDVIVIGATEHDVKEAISNAYSSYVKSSIEPRYLSPEGAEATKILLNSFLTLKIAFANLAGDILSAMGSEITPVLEAIGSDTRIGNKYFSYGYGYGGPCFPRDTAALQALCTSLNITDPIPDAISISNDHHFNRYAKTLEKSAVNHSVKIESISYKTGIDLFDYSQQLKTVLHLLANGYSVEITSGTQGQLDYFESNYAQYMDRISFNIES